MRVSRILAGGALLLLTTIFAAVPAKKPVDFGQKMLSGTTNALGHTGVVVKLVSASIAKDGTISARATIVDPDGNPLDRLGIATKGPVSLNFIATVMPAGQTQWVAYTTTVLASTINTNPSQTQAANDSGGIFTTNAAGDYTYVFKTKAPSGFDGSLTHGIGVAAFRNLSEFGTFDEQFQVSNDTFNFVPNGGTPRDSRTIVDTASCNNCHDPMFGHGGSRVKVELCIMCHTPQTINPDTQLTMDFKVLVHKIHMGSSLPSVIAGTPYRVWHRGAWSDFSAVVFPQDIRNCTACHSGTAAKQADNWKTVPTAATCTSCHDDVNLTTGVNHPAGPQANDNQCAQCHTATAVADFDASIPGAHLIPANSTSLPGIVSKILKVDNATPGSAPIVTFSEFDKSGNPIDITKLTSIRMVIAGDNSDYGVSLARVTETLTTAVGSNGLYTYQMTTKLPANAAGSYTVSIEATNNVTLLPGTTKQVVAADNAKPVEFYFSVDSSAVQARRQVVALSKCAGCHVDLSFAHNGARSNTQECVLCHNPTLTDGTSKQSVNFAWQIHSIHRGENLVNPYVLGTTNYQKVKFPGDLRDCVTCHLAGTYLPENVGAKALVASPGGFTPTTPPISAACQGCHDDVATASHTLANTSSLGESCTVCHGANGDFSVDRVHQRIF